MKLGRSRTARSGDKGTISNISLIAFRPEDYARLVRHVTAARVRELFTGRSPARCADTSCRPSAR